MVGSTLLGILKRKLLHLVFSGNDHRKHVHALQVAGNEAAESLVCILRYHDWPRMDRLKLGVEKDGSQLLHAFLWQHVGIHPGSPSSSSGVVFFQTIVTVWKNDNADIAPAIGRVGNYSFCTQQVRWFGQALCACEVEAKRKNEVHSSVLHAVN